MVDPMVDPMGGKAEHIKNALHTCKASLPVLSVLSVFIIFQMSVTQISICNEAGRTLMLSIHLPRTAARVT